jgi:hypothetical protein
VATIYSSLFLSLFGVEHKNFRIVSVDWLLIMLVFEYLISEKSCFFFH